MPLPKVNTPTYELVLPSSGRKIRYRPFLVREEKILIMALESEDVKQITNAVIEILNNCVLTKGTKIEKMSTFDIEYLFLNVRSKSVGETIDVNVTCPDDNKTSVQMTIDLDTIKIKKDKTHKDTIKLDDSLSMKMKYPSMDQFIESNFDTSTQGDDIKTTLNMTASGNFISNNDITIGTNISGSLRSTASFGKLIGDGANIITDAVFTSDDSSPQLGGHLDIGNFLQV